MKYLKENNINLDDYKNWKKERDGITEPEKTTIETQEVDISDLELDFEGGDEVEYEVWRDVETDQLYKVELEIVRDYGNHNVEDLEYMGDEGDYEVWSDQNTDETIEVPTDKVRDYQHAIPVRSLWAAKFSDY